MNHQHSYVGTVYDIRRKKNVPALVKKCPDCGYTFTKEEWIKNALGKNG